MAAMYITERDIEALSRLAYAEAANIARVTGNPMAAYGSIADTVMNRVATGLPYLAGDDFGDITISGAINKRAQYTAVPRNKTWEALPKAPPEVKEFIRQHLADLQNGGQSYAEKHTHYLNPHNPVTKNAKRTWAKEHSKWPSIGVGKIIHYFGSPDRVSVADYVPMYEPAMPLPTPRPPYPNASEADERTYAALTRRLAPSTPIDREFHTQRGERQRLARTLLSVGLLGLDGRTGGEREFDAPGSETLDRTNTRSTRSPVVEGSWSGRATSAPEGSQPPIHSANDREKQTNLIRQMQRGGFDPREIIQILQESILQESSRARAR